MDQSSHAQTAQEGDVEPLRKPVAVRETRASGSVTGAISGWSMWLGLVEQRSGSSVCPFSAVLSAFPMANPGGVVNQSLGSWGKAPIVDDYNWLCLLGKN